MGKRPTNPDISVNHCPHMYQFIVAITVRTAKLTLKNKSVLYFQERRLNSIKEIVRVLKNNGEALIYVWAKDQAKNNEKSSYLKQDRKNRKESEEYAFSDDTKTRTVLNETLNLPVHTNRKQFQHQDVLVPWKLKNETLVENNTFLRYYHVFEENELEDLCKKISGVEISNSYYDQGNWCVLIKKVI